MDKLSGKRKYPEPLEYEEWLRQQNFFLEAQNDSLRQKLNEYKDYTKYLADRLKKLEADI